MATTEHTSSRPYFLVWGGLLVLTTLSLLLSFAGLGAFELIAGLTIAVAKTALVLLFFMHLLEQTHVNAVVGMAALALVLLLVALTVTDVETRSTFPTSPAHLIPPPTPPPGSQPGGVIEVPR